MINPTVIPICIYDNERKQCQACNGFRVKSWPLLSGIFGAGGDALATFFPVKGVSTLAQAAYFAPRSFSGFFRTGNARALLGAFFTSAGVGAASTFIPTQ